MKPTRLILLIVSVLLLTGGILAVFQWNKPHRRAEGEEGIAISADSLAAAYASDEKAADAKYLNKSIQVSGTVAKVERNQDGQTTVLFTSADPMNSVFCTLRDKGATVAGGAPTTLKGFCSGRTTDVLITDCIILKLSSTAFAHTCHQVMKSIFLLLGLLLIAVSMNSCFYDKASVLYPQTQCDTASVKWTSTIQPIIQQQCAYVGCHAGANASAGISLTGYPGVKAIADDGSLVGSIEHKNNYTPMPRSASKLPDCQISQIRIWAAAGAPNN